MQMTSSHHPLVLFFEPMKGLSQNLDMQARDSLLPDIETLKPFHSTCRLKSKKGYKGVATEATTPKHKEKQK